MALCSRCSVEASGTASLIQAWQSNSPLLCRLYTPSCHSWALIVGTSMQEIYPQANQLHGVVEATYYRSPTCRISSTGLIPQSKTYLSRALGHDKSILWVCHFRKVVKWCLSWSVTVYWGFWLWGFLGGAGQGQPPPVFCLGTSSMSYKSTCRWLLLVLDLEVTRQYQAVNQVCC